MRRLKLLHLRVTISKRKQKTYKMSLSLFPVCFFLEKKEKKKKILVKMFDISNITRYNDVFGFFFFVVDIKKRLVILL